MITDALVEKALFSLDPSFKNPDIGERHVQKWKLAMRHAIEAVAPAIRASALEEAATVADARAARADVKFDGMVKRARKGERNLELAAATAAGMNHDARAIAAAIRSLATTGGPAHD